MVEEEGRIGKGPFLGPFNSLRGVWYFAAEEGSSLSA